jgi:hypothetical protein
MKISARQKRPLGAALALAVVLVTGAAAPGAAAPGQLREVLHTITGRIELPGGERPADRYEVTLRPVLGGGSREIFSDSGGRFVFEDVRAGTYTVAVSVPKAAPFEGASAEVRVDSVAVPSNVGVTVTLKAKAAPPAPLSGRAIDARETDADVPSEARKAYRRGVAAAAKGRAAEAVRHYREALEAAPDFLFALNDLGVSLTRAGAYAEATDVLRRAVALAPASFPPSLNLAIALLGARSYDEAALAADRAAELDPSAPEPPFVAARVAWARGDRELAAERYNQAFRLGGFDLAVAQFELGQLYEEMGLRREAARAYATYLSIVPDGPESDAARARMSSLGTE